MVTRIIAGAAKSVRLSVPPAGTRPTSDRVREALFGTLDSWGILPGARVLDLYAGSGALGLEAISRGAQAAVLVEQQPAAARVITRNIQLVRSALAASPQAEAELTLVTSSVQQYLRGAGSQAGHPPVFDLILIDPPYDVSEAALSQDLVLAAELLADDGVVLVERSKRSAEPRWPNDSAAGTLERFRTSVYGETALWWAEKAL